MAPELLQLAEERTKAINAAYEQLKQWNLMMIFFKIAIADPAALLKTLLIFHNAATIIGKITRTPNRCIFIQPIT